MGLDISLVFYIQELSTSLAMHGIQFMSFQSTMWTSVQKLVWAEHHLDELQKKGHAACHYDNYTILRDGKRPAKEYLSATGRNLFRDPYVTSTAEFTSMEKINGIMLIWLANMSSPGITDFLTSHRQAPMAKRIMCGEQL